MKSRFKQVTLNVQDVKPNPKNPRIDLRPGMPLYEKLKHSIEHFDYIDPIIWNKTTGMIVSGHQRFQVMKDIAEERGEKFDTVDVMEVEMTEAEQDSFMVAVNKITGLWDTEKLTALFQELSDEDLSYTGYEDFEIEALLNPDTDDGFGDDGDGFGDDNGNEKDDVFKITVYFDSQEDMDRVSDELKEKGYKVKN